MVARGDVRRVVSGRGDRKGHLDDPARERPRYGETGLGEDTQHGPIAGDHLGDETLDSLLGGARRQLLEQSRADAAPLVVVGDGEGDLGRLALAQAHVTGQRHDPLTVVGSNRAEKRPTLRPFGVEIRRD